MKEMQIKTTVRCNHTWNKMVKIKKQNQIILSNYWGGYGVVGLSYIAVEKAKYIHCE